jgi:hypothetical protein
MSEEKEALSNAKHPIMDNILAMTYRTVVACEEKEATDMIVATLRLPVSVGAYVATTDALTKQYGPGLTVRQHGEFMIVEKPGKESEEA